MGKRVLITGASGYLGTYITRRLLAMPDIERVVGIDIRQPSHTTDKFVFVQRDVREPLQEIIREHEVDAIIHAAYVKVQIHAKALMEDINVNGARNVLRSAVESQVRQIIHMSSAAVYGFHPDNDNPLREDSPLRANDDYVYSKNKKEIEGLFRDFVKNHPEIMTAIVRPVFVVGKGFDDPMARHLRHSVVIIPTTSAPLQFVHEDDLAEIICMLLAKRIQGIFNIGAAGTLTFPEMADMLGHRKLFVPFKLMYYLNAVAWALRLRSLSESPSSGLNGVRYPWIVSSEKLIRETGYVYKYSSREAFADWVRHVEGKAEVATR